MYFNSLAIHNVIIDFFYYRKTVSQPKLICNWLLKLFRTFFCLLLCVNLVLGSTDYLFCQSQRYEYSRY